MLQPWRNWSSKRYVYLRLITRRESFKSYMCIHVNHKSLDITLQMSQCNAQVTVATNIRLELSGLF
jgi:hypothetical protein